MNDLNKCDHRRKGFTMRDIVERLDDLNPHYATDGEIMEVAFIAKDTIENLRLEIKRLKSRGYTANFGTFAKEG